MYKQPTNKHRVLAMKDKFENKISNNTIQNNAVTFSQVKSNNISQTVVLNNNNATIECANINIVPYLPKQINGSPKRIVKRSEAFRRDKNSSDSTPAFQRNFALRTSYRTKNIDDKIKLFDNNIDKPLQRSGSLSDLYTTPLRKRAFTKENQSISNVGCKNYLELEECDNCAQNNANTIVEHGVMELQNGANLLNNCEHDISIKHLESHLVLQSLQETFKDALKKPLPLGPAPSKPPRTFVYSPNTNNKPIENYDYKSMTNQKTREKPPILKKESRINRGTHKFVRNDPKYMLDKLETALKNNKMKFKRQERIDSSFTSEDENETESPNLNNSIRKANLNESSNKVHLAIEDKSDDMDTTFLNGLSTFKPEEFRKVKNKKWEPIYAEPFHHNKVDTEGKNEKPTAKRNSLYYLSTPVTLVHQAHALNFQN